MELRGEDNTAKASYMISVYTVCACVGVCLFVSVCVCLSVSRAERVFTWPFHVLILERPNDGKTGAAATERGQRSDGEKKFVETAIPTVYISIE